MGDLEDLQQMNAATMASVTEEVRRIFTSVESFTKKNHAELNPAVVANGVVILTPQTANDLSKRFAIELGEHITKLISKPLFNIPMGETITNPDVYSIYDPKTGITNSLQDTNPNPPERILSATVDQILDYLYNPPSLSEFKLSAIDNAIVTALLRFAHREFFMNIMINTLTDMQKLKTYNAARVLKLSLENFSYYLTKLSENLEQLEQLDALKDKWAVERANLNNTASSSATTQINLASATNVNTDGPRITRITIVPTDVPPTEVITADSIQQQTATIGDDLALQPPPHSPLTANSTIVNTVVTGQQQTSTSDDSMNSEQSSLGFVKVDETETGVGDVPDQQQNNNNTNTDNLQTTQTNLGAVTLQTDTTATNAAVPSSTISEASATTVTVADLEAQARVISAAIDKFTKKYNAELNEPVQIGERLISTAKTPNTLSTPFANASSEIINPYINQESDMYLGGSTAFQLLDDLNRNPSNFLDIQQLSEAENAILKQLIYFKYKKICMDLLLDDLKNMQRKTSPEAQKSFSIACQRTDESFKVIMQQFIQIELPKKMQEQNTADRTTPWYSSILKAPPPPLPNENISDTLTSVINQYNQQTEQRHFLWLRRAFYKTTRDAQVNALTTIANMANATPAEKLAVLIAVYMDLRDEPEHGFGRRRKSGLQKIIEAEFKQLPELYADYKGPKSMDAIKTQIGLYCKTQGVNLISNDRAAALGASLNNSPKIAAVFSVVLGLSKQEGQLKPLTSPPKRYI